MGRQAPEIPPQVSEEPHKFLLQEVASLDWRLKGRYQVPPDTGQRKDEAIVTQQAGSRPRADMINAHSFAFLYTGSLTAGGEDSV